MMGSGGEMKKDINLLIKWLNIPKNKINFYPFPKHLNMWYGLGGKHISINTNKPLRYKTLHLIIHEYIHFTFWKTGEYLDLQEVHKAYILGKINQKQFTKEMLLREQITDLFALFILSEFTEKFSIKNRRLIMRYLTEQEKSEKKLSKYYFPNK